MAKYLKLFEEHSDYEDFIESEDFILPNVSLCEDQPNVVHFNPFVETRLVIEYTVSQNENPSIILYDNDGLPGSDIFNSVEINGVNVPLSVLDSNSGVYELNEGVNVVKYELKNATIVPDYAFNIREDSHITDITLPNSIVEIKYSAFVGAKITSMDLPSSVAELGDYAFGDCTNLTSIIVRNTTPLTLDTDTFYQCSSLAHIYVPSESVNAYKAATNWSAYASIIQAIPS